MSGRIPRSFIDDLLARADIVEIIDSFVTLKKAGKNYQACCPFHNEKSPSFTVAPDKQFYHCFGCGAHGNAISFLMEYERMEFVEAIEELARLNHLEVPREDSGSFRKQTPQQKQQLDDDFQLMDRIAKFFMHQLRNHPQANKVISYLKSRGLSGEITKTYEIGFAPPEWDSVLKHFGSNPMAIQQLIDLKLVNQKDNGHKYDFFRDRLMFPIRDKRDRIVGFGGRILDGDGPKYLNSPETRIFDKGSELYGLFRAKNLNRKAEQFLIVEGYMDVVALAQFDIDYGVAALGTSTTEKHIKILFAQARSNTVICCYDGDRAGKDAAWRALENITKNLKDGFIAKFLFLPDGEDPDTLIRKIGKQEFERIIDKATSFSTFLLDEIKKRFDLTTVDGKANLKASVIPMIEEIPGEQQKQFLLEELAYLTGETNKVIAEKRLQEANQSIKARKTDYEIHKKTSDSPVRRLIHLLLHAPEVARQVPEIKPQILVAINLPGMNLLRDIHRMCISDSEIIGVQILERFREHPHYPALQKLMIKEMPSGKNLVNEFKGNMERLIELQLESRLDELTTKARLKDITKDEQREMQLLVMKLNS